MSNLTNIKLKTQSARLGYALTDADCSEIRSSCSYPEESTWSAVTDYLNAFETCKPFARKRRKKP
jgi:hypothetical protein